MIKGQFYSEASQIMNVFSVEFVVEDKSGERYHLSNRAVARSAEEVCALVRKQYFKGNYRLISFIDEPEILGKDRSWLALGKSYNKAKPRLTNEVSYVSARVR